ncbi:MAG: TIGR00282 family metallophosphoesterase [Candidatus Abyssobacteria bacterium SURF_17]|uniref:TIGR00282 family metallophosphoesterase n=1 Tax=Candidatus Abyssobacteria bacterium SURF_17 TaxID=2093361 RepID=A0A419F1C4_9BACT|nr:MAG: TIGR00282 family metallophosphoesterase [Candidatus Abyssubacteria bacterium SURF_17]
MRILFIGDVVGEPGRRILREHLPSLKQQYTPDLTIANGENLAGGLGATPELVREITRHGVQIVTMGNHTWRRSELVKGIDSLDNIVRPANYPPASPGARCLVHTFAGGRRAAVLNLVGRIYMDANDCPFRSGLELVEQLRTQTTTIIVDMHAEATSEKVAMGWYLDGKVSAVLGTHTHIQTADERILPQGTAYITDVGMTGPHDGIIGMRKEEVLTRFVTGVHSRFEVATENLQFHAVVVHIDDTNGRALSIERISQHYG